MAAAVGRTVADHIVAGRKVVAVSRPGAEFLPVARSSPAAAVADKWSAAVEKLSSPADHKRVALL